MNTAESIVIFVTLIIAGTFLFLWMRRDKGADPKDNIS
jgi:hypothetical protein